MVLCFENCSDLLKKICSSQELLFKAEGREFEKSLRSLEQFIQTMKGQNSF